MEKRITAVTVLLLIFTIFTTLDVVKAIGMQVEDDLSYADAPRRAFTPDQISQLKKGEVVQLERLEPVFPVGLFPLSVKQKKISTDFRATNSIVQSIPGSQEVSLVTPESNRTIAITISWALIPVAGLFFLALTVSKKSPEIDFLKFSIMSCTAILLSFFAGLYFGPGVGLTAGVILAMGITAYLEKLTALFVTLLAAGSVGYYTGITASVGMDMDVMYKYIAFYSFMCILALVAGYFHTPARPVEGAT